MTSKEFTLWLKGFTEGVHEYNITPKQWDLLKEKLEEVKDEQKIGTPIGNGWGVPSTAPIMPLPYYPNPLDNPWKPMCDYPGAIDSNPFKYGMTSITGSGTTSIPGFAFTTTPGYGSITYNPSTTTNAYPSGSLWHYTNGGNNIKD